MTSPTIDPFQPIPHPYVRQLARAYRFLDRYIALREVPIQFGVGTSFNDLEDNMWAFVWNCWHVRDWIRNDPDLKRDVKKRILTEVEQAANLRIIADLANGTKHFTTSSRSTREGARQSVIQFSPRFGGGFRADHLVRMPDGRELQLLETAQKAMTEWRDILKRHGLEYFVDPTAS